MSFRLASTTPVTFTPDGKGFYYTRNNRQGTLLYLHEIGTRNSHDALIFGHEFHGEPLGPIDLFRAEVTDDGRYLVVTIERGVPARRVDICLSRSHQARLAVRSSRMGSRLALFDDLCQWRMVREAPTTARRTDASSAPTPASCPRPGRPSCLTANDVIETFSIVGGKIYVKRLNDVKSETSVYTLDGKLAGTVDYDGIGSASGVIGRTIDRYGFFSFESSIQPPTIYRLDTLTGKRELFAQPKSPLRHRRNTNSSRSFQINRRHPGPHVHRRQERPASGRLGAPADDRLWRL